MEKDEKGSGGGDMVNCPYYHSEEIERKLVNPFINCLRGLASRTKTFDSNAEMDIHEAKFCNDKYTRCNKYKQLESDWGHIK